jgi:hypothetical protein
MRSPALLFARSAAVVLAFSAVPLTASAQTVQTDMSPGQMAFRLGRSFAAERRYDVACPKFEESYRLEPTANTLFFLADCWTHTGRLAAARARFLEVAETANRAGQKDLEMQARAQAAEIESKLPALVVNVDAKDVGLEISMDGVPLRSAEWGTPVPLDPGKHVIEARAPNKRGRKLILEMPREPQTVSVTVPPLDGGSTIDQPQAEQKPAPTSLTAEYRTIDGTLLATGVVLGAVGVAGVAVGVAEGLKVNSKNRDADAVCPAGLGCTPEEVAAYDSAMADARSARRLSLAGFAIGGAAIVGSVVLLVSAPRTEHRTVALAPALDRGTIGATLSGRW